MRAWLVFVLTTLLVVPGIVALPQDTGTTAQPAEQEADQEQTAQEQEPVFHDKIVVTAARQEQGSAETPAPITVISRDEIEHLQPEKMVDLFKQVPGVEITGEGPFRGMPVIRGFTSNRVLILVDGQRLNNARESTLFAGIQTGLVDLTQVERIEVLRGPASVLYGSDAMGGVINIITRVPSMAGEEMEWHGSAGYSYGDNADSQRVNVDIEGAGQGFSFRVAGGYQEVEDYHAPKDAADDERFSSYVDEDGRVFNSGMKQTSFDTTLRWVVGEQGLLRASAEIVRSDDIGFPGFDPESGIDITFPRFDRDKVSFGWDSGPVAGLDNITLSTYYQRTIKESRRNLDFGPYFYLFNTTRSDIDSYGFNAQVVAELGINHLTFGMDYYRDNLDDDTVAEDPFSGVNTEVTVPRSHQQGIGIYLQDEIRFSDRLKVLAGLRGDRILFKSEDDPDYTGAPFDVSDSDVSGNLGLNYGITDNVTLTALVGRGFRSPNLQERAYFGPATEPGYFIIQNPDLTSERSLNYELGFKVRYDRYFGGLNLFYNDVRDLITFVDAGDDPVTGLILLQYDNIEEATIKGIELELETIFYRHWTSFFTASYTHGDNDTVGEPLGFIPPVKVLLGLRYHEQRWWSEISYRWVAKQDRRPADASNDIIGDFSVLDLRGGYSFQSGLSLQAKIANLLDKLYAEPFNNRPEPARSYRFSILYRF
jgi:hemoglobin/transferrin/lactoferrin receptor protein